MLDELDLLPDAINFGHFLKVVHETLGRERLDDVTLILAGQRGIYTRLLKEDRSVERLIRHVPLSVLDPQEARFVLEYAGDHAEHPFAITEGATEMILALSAGYPYDIHLIGDAAFTAMDRRDELSQSDVLRGLSDLFRSDKREKYLQRLHGLSSDQRLVAVSMSRFASERIPVRIPVDWLEQHLLGRLEEGKRLEQVLQDLVAEGVVFINSEAKTCQFAEELFRIFISLLVLDQRELDEARQIREAKKKTRKTTQRAAAERHETHRRFIQDLASEIIDEARIDDAIEVLERSGFEADWYIEDHSKLTEFEP